MDILELMDKRTVLLDGAAGTELFSRGLTVPPETLAPSRPDEVLRLHREYFAAGADCVLSCTLCAGLNGQAEAERQIAAAVALALEAKDGREDRFAALDIGPCPGADAAHYAALARAGARHGAELVMLETFTGLSLARPALEGAREAGLPVFMCFSFGPGGTLQGGASPGDAARFASSLGADAVGLNCGMGAARSIGVLRELADSTRLPVIFKPCARIPEGSPGAFYDPPEEFARAVSRAVSEGARAVGGCCGAGPRHIAALAAAIRQKS